MTEDDVYVALPPNGLICTLCAADIPAGKAGAIIEVSRAPGSSIGIAVGVCRPCCAEHASTESALGAMIARIQTDESVGPQPSPPSAAACAITLPRRNRTGFPRRHPAYGARLAANPPPAGDSLTVAVGWENAKQFRAPLIVVQPEDSPARLRFDIADGREVIVIHGAASDPGWLLNLAQAIIDDGAESVELVVYPQRPGAIGTESLRVSPEPAR